MTLKNFQCVVYYLNPKHPIGETSEQTPYQGEIVGAVSLVQGHIPTQNDVEFMTKYVPEFRDGGSVLVIAMCLN